MIIYHPYKDANHCTYRIISILHKCQKPVNINYLHLADFYHLFPSQLKNIDKWPRKNTRLYKHIHNLDDTYESFDNPKRVFYELKNIRRNVLINLLSKKIITYLDSNKNLIKLNIELLPESILDTLNKDSFRKSLEFKAITDDMESLTLYGESGLKAKSGLMEYRYDI
ncbi:ABC-three component system middle component 5 [Vibrio fluvialis]